MAITIYEKTEMMPTTSKLSSTGWLIIDTTINQDVNTNLYSTINRSKLYQKRNAGTTRIYCHIEAPTEPVTDGSILTSDFDTTGSQTDTAYSGNGFFKYFTSETGFFTADQDLGASESLWTIYYVSKYANKTEGYVAWLRLYFYKRDGSNNDTELFRTDEMSVGSFYVGNGQSATVNPSGNVLTTDRLRIGLEGGESIAT